MYTLNRRGSSGSISDREKTGSAKYTSFRDRVRVNNIALTKSSLWGKPPDKNLPRFHHWLWNEEGKFEFR